MTADNRSVTLFTRPTERLARWQQGAVAILIAAAAGAACDKVPLMAPSESLIALFTNATSMPINGTVEITATVIESAGTPVQNGTVVTFFTTLGRVDPPEARTEGGKATVRLHAGTQSGTATVRAASGGNSTKDPQLTIAIGSAAAGRVEVFANPAALPSGGGTVQLTAAVYDTGGNRLPSVQVSFSADNGSLSPNTAITDGNGEARSTLTATLATKVTVTVAGSSEKPVTTSVDVKVRSAPDVTLTVNTTTPTEFVPVVFTISVKPGTSGAAVRAASIEFGDGASQAVGANGQSTASHTYTDAGTYIATATATDPAGETSTATASVNVRVQTPVTVTLTVTPSTTNPNVPVTFTASASVPAPNTIDHYEWDFGNGTKRTTNGGSTVYIYPKAGRFTASVRVVSTDGIAGSAEADVLVVAIPTLVSLTASDLTPEKDTPVTFTATVTPSTVVVTLYEWDFGDGNKATTTSGSIPHTYTTVGSKSVTVKVTATDGSTATGRMTVEVVAAT